MSKDVRFPCLSCGDCKFHERIWDEGEDDDYSYCHKKKERLYFLERNWHGSWCDYEYTCFRPTERCRQKLDEYYDKVMEK